MLSTVEIASAIASLKPIDLKMLGVPRPHFLRAATILHGGRALVGEVWFPRTYEALQDRGARVNAAECLHAAWNAAHMIGGVLGGGKLRARRLTITPGRRPIPAETSLVMIAQLTDVNEHEHDYHGEFLAELLDQRGRVLLAASVDFWAGRREKVRRATAHAF